MTEWIVSSCLLIAVILMTRWVFRSKLRPRVQYALWALVLVRLLVPFSFFQSSISPEGFVEEVKKQPAIQSVTDKLTTPNISYEQAYDQAVQDFLQSGQEFTPEQTLPDYTAPNYVPLTPLEQHTQEILDNSTPAVRLETVLLWIWIGGMAVTGFCFLLSNLKFRKHLRQHRCPLPGHPAPLQVYACDRLDTPCLFGLFRPAVYLLPEEAVDEAKAHHILTHELTHYCHGDHIWAILRCVCLVLHWYNPLVWLAAILSRRDAELACDEATVRKLGEDHRHAYGMTLIEATCARSPGAGLMNTATTMTGSKAAIKERVTRIAKKQKLSIPALIAVLLIAAIAVGCAFSGTGDAKLPQLSAEKRASLQAYFDKIGLDSQFYAPETNEEGLRYYGSFYDENGKEYIALFQSYGAITADHKLFEDCNVPVQLNYGGQQLTHRAPFIIHFLHASDYYDGDYYDSPFLTHQYNALEFVTPPSFVNKEFLSKLAETHRKYEKQIYGSVAKIITTDDEEAAKKQAHAVFNMATSGWMTSLLFNYGQYDGYCVLSHSHGVSLTDQPTTVGGKEFPYYSNEIHLVAFKDGTLYNIDQLYADGKFSDSALSQLAKKHEELYRAVAEETNQENLYFKNEAEKEAYIESILDGNLVSHLYSDSAINKFIEASGLPMVSYDCLRPIGNLVHVGFSSQPYQKMKENPESLWYLYSFYDKNDAELYMYVRHSNHRPSVITNLARIPENAESLFISETEGNSIYFHAGLQYSYLSGKLYTVTWQIDNIQFVLCLEDLNYPADKNETFFTRLASTDEEVVQAAILEVSSKMQGEFVPIEPYPRYTDEDTLKEFLTAAPSHIIPYEYLKDMGTFVEAVFQYEDQSCYTYTFTDVLQQAYTLKVTRSNDPYHQAPSGQYPTKWHPDATNMLNAAGDTTGYLEHNHLHYYYQTGKLRYIEWKIGNLYFRINTDFVSAADGSGAFLDKILSLNLPDEDNPIVKLADNLQGQLDYITYPSLITN